MNFTRFLPYFIVILAFNLSCKQNENEKYNGFSDERILESYGDTAKMITVRYSEQDTNIQIKSYFYKNGKEYMSGKMINGLREGEWVAYSEQGQILTKGNYKNGIDHGFKIVYYDNGNIRYQGNFDNGKKVGKWQFYTEDGKLVKELDF